MVASLTVLALATLTLGNWALVRRWTFPSVILGIVWTATTLVYFIDEGNLYPLKTPTAVMFLLGYVCFSIGSHFPRLVSRSTRLHAPVPVPTHNGRSGNWIVAVACIGLPFFAYRVYQVGSAGPSDNLLFNVRLAISEEGTLARLGYYPYLATFSIFGAGLHVLGLVRTSRWKRIILLAVSAAYAFLGTARTSFLLLFSLVGGGLAVTRRVRASALIAFAGGGFLLAFGVIAILLNKGISADSGIASGFATTFKQYLLGGTAGLNDYLSGSVPLAWGENTFRFVFALLNRLGIDVEPRPLLLEFRRVPFPTNVYTVHRHYFEDFGWPGVMIFQALFGALHGVCFLRARQGSSFFAFGYGALLYPLIMQVFADQYFSLMSSWVQAALLLGAAKIRLRPRQEPGRIGLDYSRRSAPPPTSL